MVREYYLSGNLKMFVLLFLMNLNIISTFQGNGGYAGTMFEIILNGNSHPVHYLQRLYVIRTVYTNDKLEVKIRSNITRIYYVEDTMFVYNLTSDNNETTKVRVQTSEDVYVRMEVFKFHSNDELQLVDVYNCIPSSNLGKEYYVMTSCHVDDSCQLFLAGTGNSTLNVNVTINNLLEITYEESVYKSGDIIQVALSPFEVWSFQSVTDLTGIKITGDSTFVVYSGVQVNSNANKSSSIRQLPSVSNYGKFFTVFSISKFKGDLIKILTSKAETQIYISSNDPFIVPHPGTWIQRFLTPGQSRYIYSNKPILVYQYEVDEVDSNLIPVYESTLIIPPIEQWSVNARFAVPSDKNSSANMSMDTYNVTIISHNDDINTLTVNGTMQSFISAIPIEKSSYISRTMLLEANDNYTINALFENAVTWGFVSNGYRFPFYNDLRILVSDCHPTEMTHGDFIDNDCDNYIDEDDCTTSYGALDHLGTEFFVTFPEHHGSSPLSYLYFSTNLNQEVEIHVSIPRVPGAVWNETFTIRKENGHFIQTDSSTVQMAKGTYVECNGIYIISDGDISVSGMSAHRDTAGSFLALPKDALGLEYIFFTDCNGGPQPCECAIVATADNTYVDVLFPSEGTISVTFIGRLFRQGEVIHVILDKFDVFQIQGEANQDLTGTHVLSDKPIAVFCGGSRPSDDYVVEQLPPITAWGRSFQSPSIPYCSNCRLYVIPSQENTNINFSPPTSLTTSCYGHCFYMPYDGNIKYRIVTSKPVMLALILNGVASSGYLQNQMMVIIPPTDQYILEQSIFVPNNPNMPSHYLIGIDCDNDTMSVFIDESLVSCDWVNTTSGDHLINSSAPIFAFVIGFGKKEAGLPWNIAFPVGMKLNSINKMCKVTNAFFINDMLDNDCDGAIDEEVCLMGTENSKDPTFRIVGGYADCLYIQDDHESTSYKNELITTLQNQYTTDLYYYETSTQNILATPIFTTEDVPSISQTVTLLYESLSASTTSFRNPEYISMDTVTHFNDIPVASSISPTMSEYINMDITTIDHSTTISIPLSPSTSENINIDNTAMTSITVSFKEMEIVSTSDDFSSVIRNSNTVAYESCECPCSVASAANGVKTKEDLNKQIEEIRRELSVEKTKLSATIRKLTSADDTRTSAKTIGYFGVAVLVSVSVLILLLDLPNLVKHACQVKQKFVAKVK